MSQTPPSPALAPAAPAAAVAATAISRVRFPREKVKNQHFRNMRLDDVNAKSAEFDGCDFSYSIIERGYFREARFTDCVFTGARFIDCNFRRATFYSCDLSYALFSKCLVDIRELVASLPQKPNIRRESLQTLRSNAIETGDYENLGLLVMQEVEATADHYRRALNGSDEYYKQKYATFSKKAVAAINLLALRLSGFVWGHGERPASIFISGATFLLVFALLNFWSVMPRVGWRESVGGLLVMKYVVELFLFLDPDKNYQGFAVVDYSVAIMRYVYVGLFVSVVYKRISHR